MVCWKFLSLYSSARIFEIGYDLTKLIAKVRDHSFFWDTVYIAHQHTLHAQSDIVTTSVRLPASDHNRLCLVFAK